MATRTVSVDLRAKVGNYVSGMKQAEAATERVEKSTRLAKIQMTAMGVAGAAAGAYIAAQFARKIITAASDLNETVNKSSVVFGKNAAAMQAWSKTAATSFGMSQNAALGAASTYGNLFVSLGLGQDESAKMSKRLVELAGDLASFNNVDPTAALDALRSGLVGEQEPLRKLGISLQEATLKQKALDMGLVDSTKGVLPPAIKAQAAYALILEQSKTAQGDFARTSGGLANQTRILNAELENAQAALGQALLPAATDAVTVLNKMLGAFNALPQPVKAVALAVAALATTTVVALPRLVAFKQALDSMGPSGQKVGAGLKGIGGIIAGPWGVALAGATLALGAYLDAQNNATEAASAFADSLDQVTGAATEQTFRVIADQLSKDISLEDWKQIPFTMADVTAAVVQGGDAYATMVRRIEDFRDAQNLSDQAQANSAHVAQSLLSSMGNQNETAYDGARAFEANKAATEAATAAFGGAGGAVDDFSGKVSGATVDTREFAEQLKNLTSASVDTLRAQMNVADSASTLSQSIRENGNSFNIATAAGSANMGALLDLVGAINDHAAAVYTQTGSVAQATGAMEVERAALINNLTATGMSTGAASALVDQFLRIPAAAATAAGGLQGFAAAALNAWNAAGSLLASVAGANKSNVNIGFNYKVPSVPKVSVPKVATPKVPKAAKSGSTFRAPSAGIMDGFNPDAYSDAVKRSRQAVKSLAEAQIALADARRKVNEAGSPSEQAAALREQAQAERDVAAAKREVAAADKAKAAEKSPGKSILGDFKDRARKLDAFRRNLKILAKRGLSRTIIMQMLEAGIDDGGAMAAALVKDGNIAQLNRTQRMIAQDQRALGIAYGDNATSSSDGGSGGTTGTTGSSSASVVLSFQNASRPIVLKMDSTQVWKGLLALRRSNGGASLGLG